MVERIVEDRNEAEEFVAKFVKKKLKENLF